MASPPRQAPASKGPTSKGHGLTADWHGVPVWALAAGGALLAYFLYEHFKSSSSASASGATPAYAFGQPGSTTGRGGSGSQPPGQPQPVQPVNGKCPPGYLYRSPCQNMAKQCIPPGAIYNCPESVVKKTIPYSPSTKSVKTPGSTAISTVTPAQSAQAQKSLAQAVQSLSTTPKVTTESGQTTTTGQLAYQNLVSKGYTSSEAQQISEQIAAANSGVAPGTPQLVAGTPVVSGSSSATNVSAGITPAQAAQQAAAQQAAAQQAALQAEYANQAPSSVPGLTQGQIAAQQEAQSYFLSGGTGIPPGFVT